MLQVCRAPRCPDQPKPGRRYCERHTQQRDRTRNQSRDRTVYNSNRWKYLRRHILTESPFCSVDGCGELATDVDHIVPIAKGGDPYARANVQPLCAHHHGIKTKAEQ